MTTDLGQVTTRPDDPAGAVPASASQAPAHPHSADPQSAVTTIFAIALVAAVVPLVVLQIPDAIAWALPPHLAAGGPLVVASLLRASNLALPAMAVAVPLGALAVRRLRTGPVLLAGLLVIAMADALGDSARTVLAIGVDRSLHGVGAGIAMAALAAIIAEQRRAPRALAGAWVAVTVTGLAAAPALMRHRVTPGAWHAALAPYPWLTAGALVLAALYALLAEGSAAAAARSVFPVAERAQLALLVAPVAGICAVAVAVTYRGDRAVAAAAIADAIALSGVAAMTARVGAAARLAVVCAVAGFTLAPTAGAVTALVQPTVASGCATLASALCGTGLALLPRPVRGGSRSLSRAVTAAGLFLAAAGFGAAYLAGAPSLHGRLLTLLCVPLAGGLSAALASSLRATGAAGAMAGVVILLVGVVAGYLAAGALQLQALAGDRTGAAIHNALVLAAGRWSLLAAAVTAIVALALAGTAARSTAGPSGGELDDIEGGSLPAGAGGALDHG